MTRRTRRTRAVAFITAGTILILAGCGGGSFKDRPRPAVPVELTGVIKPDKLTVSPRRVGAGPILITISNQTKEAHTVTLEGRAVRARVGPIQPEDTATIQESLNPGSYQVRAGSSVATPKQIQPAQLSVGPRRRDSGDRLLLP